MSVCSWCVIRLIALFIFVYDSECLLAQVPHPFLVMDASAPEHDGKAFGRVWRQWEEADQLSVTTAQTLSQRGQPSCPSDNSEKEFSWRKAGDSK